MTTPHSLPSTSQRTGTQLPFSPTPTNAAPRLPGLGRQHSGSTSSNQPSTRPGSIVSSRSRPPNLGHTAEPAPLSLPPSPTVTIFQPRPIHTSTHAGGILPPASFFHPSRPSYPPPSTTPPQQRPSRPSSTASIVSTAEAPTFEAVRLATLSEQQTHGSEASESIGHSTEEFKDTSLNPSLKSAILKPSREPLLPIGPRTPRISTTRPTLNTQLPYRTSETNLSAGGRVRDSFEKLFKRGFSFEGSRKSPSSPTGNGAKAPFGARSGNTSPVSVPRMLELNATANPHAPAALSRKRSLSPTHASTPSLAHLAFVPVPPPDMRPPLAAVPMLHPESKRLMRNWESHPSRNRFFLGGRFLTGGDSPWAFVGSLVVVLSITGVWFGTTCVWWWRHESPAVAVVGAYMCLLTMSSMFATAFRDPGILPRNLDPDPPYPSHTSSESLRAPLPRDLKVRAGIVRTKYCQTCRTYRPPRSSHCKMCDNCVDGCDHHCQWVNNCVGRRNYTSFFTFLLSAVLTLILVICTTAIHLWLLTRDWHLSFRQALSTSDGAGSAVAFSMSILLIWPVMALLVYHLRLLLLNVTTIEQIRNQAHKSLVPGDVPPNPFSHGSWRRNLVYMLCRPTGSSWLDFSAVATEDKREVNPGLQQEGWIEEAEEGRRGHKGE
ncbi:hypothetical protein AcV5_006528 [Taiwanofungus camphoratus]|nr:hypothetical protein AcW2_004969 [Antrodia cinnamomea]KAI0934799.1 hypothetical protein AcV5_006528 [Antrodia cinnamomea]